MQRFFCENHDFLKWPKIACKNSRAVEILEQCSKGLFNFMEKKVRGKVTVDIIINVISCQQCGGIDIIIFTPWQSGII